MLYRSKNLSHCMGLILLCTSFSSFAMFNRIASIFSIRNLSTGRHRGNNSSKVTSKTSMHEITGDKTYTTVYPIVVPKGLIRIKDYAGWRIDKDHTLYPGCLYPNDCQNITVTIERHTSNEVIVETRLDKRIVKLVDQGEDANKQRIWHEFHKPSNFYKEREWIWVPWLDNTITNLSNYLKKERNSTLRGDNRLDLTLEQPGHYYITVPQDADIEIELSEGDIHYASRAKTKLSIESSTVNYWGDSGSHGPSGERWSYFWGSESSPITNLKTQKGHIELPPKN